MDLVSQIAADILLLVRLPVKCPGISVHPRRGGAHRENSDFFVVSNELRSARLAARICSLLKRAVAGSPQRIAFLEESSSDYMQLIKTFEGDRVELKRRLATADAAEAARLEQGLRVNQRGLELLQNALARIKAELAQEREKPDP